MNLSPREQRIFDFMKERQDQDVALDDIITCLRLDPTKLNNRYSVNSSVKVLSYKLSPLGYSLSRQSKIGRAAKAIYSLSQHWKEKEASE